MYIVVNQDERCKFPNFCFETQERTCAVTSYVIPGEERDTMEHHVYSGSEEPALHIIGTEARGYEDAHFLFTRPESGYAKSVPCAILDRRGEQVGEVCILEPTILSRVMGKKLLAKYHAEFDDTDESFEAIVIAMGRRGFRIPLYCDGTQIGIVEKTLKMSLSTKMYDMWLPKQHMKDIQKIAALLSYLDSMEFGNRGELSLAHHSARSGISTRDYRRAFNETYSEELKKMP